MITGFVVAMTASFLFAWNASSPLQTQWSHYLDHVAKREDLLMEIRAAFGYGGLIHNFKNYVLRAEEKYAQRAREHAGELRRLIKEYRALGDVTAQEEAALNDLIAVMTAGAYGFVMGSNYNSRGRAPEVLVDGEAERLVRRRETWEDLIACEMPDPE